MNNLDLRKMNYLYIFLLAVLTIAPKSHAQSNLLESVKQNPKEAIALCNKFRSLNSKGLSASSPKALKEIANQRNLSEVDAEILSIYVIALHCPSVN